MFSLRFQEVNFWQIYGGNFVYVIFFRDVTFFVHKFLRDLQTFHFMFKITISKMRNLRSKLLFH